MMRKIAVSVRERRMRRGVNVDDRGKRLRWRAQELLLLGLLVQRLPKEDRGISLELELSLVHIWKKVGVLK
jgi:hypothetical protein